MVAAGHLALDQYVSQYQLQGIIVAVGQIDHAVEVIVPSGAGIEQADYGDDGRRQRQGDTEKLAELRSAVNPCGFVYLLGNGSFKVYAGDNHVVHGEGRDDNQCVRFVDQVKRLYEQIGWNQAARQVHDNNKVPGQKIAARQFMPAEHIGCGDRQAQAQ